MATKTGSVNILLLYPETPKDTYWSFSHCLGMIGKKAGTPPLGLVTIAAMIPRDEYSLRLVDMNVSPLHDADLEWADLVFTSAMIAQKSSLEEVLLRAKKFGKTTVAGGPYSSTAYRELDNVDVFFIGEAEGAWDAFLTDLRHNALKPAYAAPARQRETDDLSGYFGPDAHIVPSSSYPDVNDAPLPRFDLLDMDAYGSMTVQASRGCPVGCEFCDIWRRYGRKTRIKEPRRILAELDELHRLGWRDSVFLVDDNFIGNRGRAREVLAALVEWQRQKGWPFTFVTEATLSLADDPEMLDLMGQAGFASVFVGIETPSEASLRETGKHINLTGPMAEKAARIQSHGIQLMSGFIIGFDSDPDDIAGRMTACIQELGIPQAMIGLLNALPDTDLHDRLEAENRIVSQTSGNNTHAFSMNFRPARPEADVLRDYKRVLRSAYPADMKSYFERAAVLRSRWPDRVNNRSSLPFMWKVKVCSRYLATVLMSRYRFAALGFLLKTVLTRPSFLEQAFELGIKGHHHWAITRQAFEVDEMRTTLSSHLEYILEYVTGGAAATDVAAYGKSVRKQVRKQYRRLSRAARITLMDDMERFFLEMERLCVTEAAGQ